MSDPFADLIPPPSFKNVVGGGPSDPVFNREDPFSDLMPLKSGASSSAPRPLMNAGDDFDVAEPMPSRTSGEAVSDAATRVRQGLNSVVGGLVGAPVNIANALMNPPHQRALNKAMGIPTEDIDQPDFVKGIRESIGYNNEREDAALSGKARRQAAEFQATEGIGGALSYLKNNPSYLATEAAAQLPQFLQLVPGTAAGTIAAQAVGAASQNAQQVEEELRKKGYSESEIANRVNNAFGQSLALNAALPMIPGGGAVERILSGEKGNIVGSAVKRAIRPLIGETVAEAGQEGVDQVIQNYASDNPLGQGVGQASALGGIIGLGTGAPAGAFDLARGRADPTIGLGDRSRSLVEELDRQAPKTPEEHAVQTGSDIANKIFEETGASSPAPNTPELIQPNAPPRSFVPDQTPLTPAFDPQALLQDLNNEPGPSSAETIQGSAKPAENPVLTGEPELINNGKRVFYPGDTAAMRAKLEAAGLNPGMRKVGENGEDLGLYFPAKMQADVDAVLRASKPSADTVAQAEPVVKPDAPVASPVVEQSTPAPAPYEGAKLPPERKPRNQVRNAGDFDPNYHDVRDFIALNGGLDFGAFKSEFNSEIPGDNMRFFGKPLFRKKGGMKPDQLRELMQESGFLNQDSPDAPPQYTPQDAYDLVDRALDGQPVYHSQGVDTQNQIRADNEYYAEQSRRQEYIDEHGVPPELDEEFAQRASALDRGDLERMYSRRDTATGDMFGASQRSPDTPPRPAQTGLFAEPTANERNTAESAKRDAERNGLGRDLVQPSQGKGDLFAGPRPKQDVLKSQLEVPKKIRDFKTDEGQFSTYDIDSNPRGRSEMFTVQKSKDGYVVRNALVPDAMQRKGIAAKFYRDMNRESLEKTGNPLRSTAPRTLSDGRVVHELSPDAVGLWDSLVKGGVAEKTGDRAYQFKSNEIKRSQRPDTQGIEVDEATDLTPDEMAAFQRQTEPKKPERTRPDTPIIADDSVTTGLTGIARNDDAFKHPTSKKMDVADIFRDIEPDYTLSKSVEMAEANETPADTAWRITTPEGDKAALYQKGNKIWVDVSDLKQGQGGSRIYNAVANYAHNNGKVFIGDPAGLSEIAQKRRAEQMLSSALKFGTTDHMQPHPKQLQGNQELGIPKLNWKVGDTAHNIRELAKVTSEVTTKEFGEIADLTYNPETLRFERPDGREVTDADFKALAAQKRAGRDSSQSGSGKDGVVQPAPTAGVTTLKRAIIARQLASPDGGKLAGVLAGVSGRGAEHPAGKSLPNLGRVLYSRRDQTETPEFKKWFGDSKVVDAKGEPLVVYHGTAGGDFSEFKPRIARAVWFAPDMRYAQKYATARSANNENARVIEVFLSVKNPLVIDMKGLEHVPRGLPGLLRYANTLEDVVGIAQQQGYDGVIAKNRKTVEGFSGEEIAVFRPSQIKSAISNNGQFDANNPSILKSESAKPATEKPAAKESPEQAAAKNAAAEKTVAKTLGRSEIKRLKDKGNLKFLTTAQVMELGINGAKSQSDLRGVDGFYDAKSGNVYIISDSGINPDGLAGVVVHELVHSNMEAFLGTDGFQKLIKAFVRESATDAEAKAAMAHARTVDGDKSEAVQQEEGLAYFAQQNPDHPMTKRLVDEGKLFLNRLGVPLTWLNANNAALRKIIALNLKDAQYRDRSHSIGKDGVKYQRVFHGTPHRDIEKEGFKLQKIGTGEGAQAYGYGMYFASQKEIAEKYRKDLAGDSLSKPDGTLWSPDSLKHLNIRVMARRNRSDLDATIKRGEELLSGHSEHDGGINELRSDLKTLRALRDAGGVKESQGQLYHAEIPEDSDLLDYDKPLSEQPEKVKAALRKAMPDIPENMTGQDIYATLRYGKPKGFGQDGKALFDGKMALDSPTDSAKKASEYLESIGIPGLRYLDGSSRNKGEGSANYVIWDENLLTPEKAQITPYYSKRADDTPQTETPAFKKFFEGSKVVDESGEPLVVYHGTDAKFDTYDESKLKRGAFHFATEQGTAMRYGSDVSGVYLAIRNPITFHDLVQNYEKSGKDWRAAKADGFDGYFDPIDKSWVAFSPGQIKSATGNNGQFDPTNPSILASKRTPELEAAMEKAGMPTEKGPVQRAADSVREKIDAAREYDRHELQQQNFDRFHGIRYWEDKAGPIPDEQSPYIAARLSTGAGSTAEFLLADAGVKWKDGILQPDDSVKSLLASIEPVRGSLPDFLGWMAGKRAQRLMDEGRENNFTQSDIDELLALDKGREKEFKQAAKDYAAWNKMVLDVGEQAGIIDPKTRSVWENPDYVPFLREQTDQPTGGTKQTLANQKNQVKTLKGGKERLQDPMTSIIQNAYRMIDASMKNHAMLQVVDQIGHTGVLEDATSEFKQALIPMGQVKKILKDRGMTDAQIAAMPKDAFEGVQKMMSIVAPTDPNVVRIMRDGKPEYYRVLDPLLLRSLTAFKDRDSGAAMSVMRAAKRLLTAGATATPGFIIRNWIRDTAHSFIIHPDKMVPGYKAIEGALRTATKDPIYRMLAASGAGFGHGRFNAADPGASAKQIKRALKTKGWKPESIAEFTGSLVNTPAKLWSMYQKFGAAAENANRWATAQSALKSGKSTARAAFDAKDMLDFSMQGDGAIIQFMGDTLPFFNARMQGLYKLQRAGAIPGMNMRGKVAAKGLAMMLASTAYIWSIMNDPEKKELYEKLEDWDKDSSWHFWGSPDEDGSRMHYRIPKPFEVGFLFGTTAEHFYRALTKDESWGGLAERMGAGVMQQLQFNPVPQAVRPILDIYANKNSFTGREIEGMADDGKLPWDRFDSKTSPIARAISSGTGKAITSTAKALNPEAPSIGMGPKQIEYLWDQYTAGTGQYALGIADSIVKNYQASAEGKGRSAGEVAASVVGFGPNPGEPAAKFPNDTPGLGWFFKKEDGTGYTKYQTALYDTLKEADRVNKSIKTLREDGQYEEADKQEADNQVMLGFRKPFGSARKRLGDYRKQMDRIREDDSMTPQQKREAIDNIMRERNNMVEQIYGSYKAARQSQDEQ